MKGKAGRFSRFVPFDPSNLSGLTGWWDASDSSTLFDATTGGSAVAADGEVARLEDKSGNGRHFTQSSSSLRPLRKTAIRNGFDVIRFDGTDDFVEGDGFAYFNLQSAAASSIFIVANAATVDTNNAVFDNETLFSENAGGHAAFALASDDTASAWGYDSSVRTATVAYMPGSWVAFSSWHDGSSIYAQSNNGSPASATLFNRNFDYGTPQLGCNAQNTYFFDGDLGEVITYNVALSDSDRGKVISYLMNKWGI